MNRKRTKIYISVNEVKMKRKIYLRVNAKRVARQNQVRNLVRSHELLTWSLGKEISDANI